MVCVLATQPSSTRGHQPRKSGIEFRVVARRGLALDADVRLETLPFDQPPALVEERRVRHVDVATIDERGNGIQAGESAPGARADDRAETELSEIEREVFAGRNGHVADEQRLAAELRAPARRGPAVLTAVATGRGVQ